MSILNQLPFPVYIGSLILFIIALVYGLVKGFAEVKARHLFVLDIGSILGCISLIALRIVNELKFKSSIITWLNYILDIIFIIIIINLFLLVWPLMRKDKKIFKTLMFFVIGILGCIIIFVILIHL